MQNHLALEIWKSIGSAPCLENFIIPTGIPSGFFLSSRAKKPTHGWGPWPTPIESSSNWQPTHSSIWFWPPSTEGHARNQELYHFSIPIETYSAHFFLLSQASRPFFDETGRHHDMPRSQHRTDSMPGTSSGPKTLFRGVETSAADFGAKAVWSPDGRDLYGLIIIILYRFSKVFRVLYSLSPYNSLETSKKTNILVTWITSREAITRPHSKSEGPALWLFQPHALGRKVCIQNMLGEMIAWLEIFKHPPYWSPAAVPNFWKRCPRMSGPRARPHVRQLPGSKWIGGQRGGSA